MGQGLASVEGRRYGALTSKINIAGDARPSVPKPAVFISAVRTSRPATRPAHSFFKFRAYPLNVLPSGFRFLDGDNPADPLIAREWRNILPFFERRRVRKENFPQIRRHTVYCASGDRFFAHRFHSTSLRNQLGNPRIQSKLGRREKLIWTSVTCISKCA